MNPRREFLPPPSHIIDANAQLRHPAEKGSWIWHPACPKGHTAILRFTTRFRLDTPASPLLHVTGDQRFQLRCDGRDVTFGPDRCDVEHWTVHSVRIDLEPGAHAWGAHPAWHSLASIAGIRPSAPAYARVRIAPCPGNFTHIDCTAVHPRGQVRLKWELNGSVGAAELSLPAGITGEFVWRDFRKNLEPGTSHIELPCQAIPSTQLAG